MIPIKSFGMPAIRRNFETSGYHGIEYWNIALRIELGINYVKYQRNALHPSN